MRVVLTNFGTMGDYQPLLALAVELAEHGHRPVMAFSPRFEDRTHEHGFEFVPIAGDLEGIQQEVNLALMAGVSSGAHMRELMEPLVAALPGAFRELEAAVEGAAVLIGGPAQPAARMVHEVTGVPFASVQFSHFGGAGTGPLQEASAALINPVRRDLGLAPLADPLTRDANSPQLALYAMSRHVRPPQAEWPPHFHITGFFHLEEPAWDPDPELAAFFADGPPPAVLGFGSMTHDDPRAVNDALLGAVEQVGCRAVIQQGWGELGATDLPDGVVVAGFVPHGWLFPRASVIVHHGGGGTAGAVFRSGVPSVFVPHGAVYDQTYWARLAEEIGIAGPTIPIGELSADRLAASMKAVLDDPGASERAKELGAKVRAEPGVRLARRLIEDLVRRVGLTDVGTESKPSKTRFWGRRRSA